MRGGDLVHFRPRGHYLAHEVGRLAGVSGDRIGQWARRGYIRSSQSATVPRIYSYQDVAEAMIVHQLVLASVELREIKKAINILRLEYGDWPLTHAPIATASLTEHGRRGTRAKLVREEAGGVLMDLSSDPLQQVLDIGNVASIARDLHRGGWAVRALPDLKHIEVDPDRLSGRPAIRDSRVPAEMVAAMADQPGGMSILKRDYDITPRQIHDARRWWAEVQSYEVEAA